MPIKLGELLVKENVITPQQLQEALQHQKERGGKLGSSLVALGFLTDEAITHFLSRQYGVPRSTSPNSRSTPRSLSSCPPMWPRSTRSFPSPGPEPT